MKRNLAVCLCLAGLLSAPAAAQPDKKKVPPPDPPDGLKALEHPDPTVRYNAAQLLVQLGPVGKFAIPALRKALKDQNGRVRIKVAEALWWVEKPAARTLLPTLVAGLKDKDAVVRANALGVLAQIGPGARTAVPEITKALTDKEREVRTEAVMTLGEMGPAARTAIPALLATLEDDELRLLEPLVAVTLGNVGESAVPALKKALAGKKVPQKRAAAFALAQIGPKAADAVPALTETLNDGEAEVRALAAKALGKVGPAAKDSVPKLKAALQDKEIRVRVGAALALLQAGGGADGLKVLTEALKDGSAFVRVEAYRALGEFGAKGSSAVLRVLDGLRDDNARVRSAAAEAARRIPATNDVDKLTVVAGLLTCLMDEDEDVRLSAAWAMWPLTQADTHVKLTKTVAAALESQSPSARKRAATILAGFGREARAAVPALVTALRDLDPGVREAVADALKKIDPAAAAKAGVR